MFISDNLTIGRIIEHPSTNTFIEFCCSLWNTQQSTVGYHKTAYLFMDYVMSDYPWARSCSHFVPVQRVLLFALSSAEIISNTGTMGRGYKVSSGFMATEGYASQASTFTRGYARGSPGERVSDRYPDGSGVAMRAQTLGGKRGNATGNEVSIPRPALGLPCPRLAHPHAAPVHLFEFEAFN